MTEAPPPVEPALEPIPEAPPPAAEGTNGLAIASLVCGIVGCIPGAGIAAIVTGHMALGRIKMSGQGGRGMAIIGLILGYLSIVGWIIVILTGGLAIFGMVSEVSEISSDLSEMPPPPM